MGFLKNVLDKAINGGRKTARKARKAGSSIAENTMKEFFAGIKKIFIAVILPLLIKALVIVVLLAAAWEIIANLATETSATTISSFVSSASVSTSLKEQYNVTGSLLLATDEDISQMATSYDNSIEGGDLSYLHSYFNKKYSNKDVNNSGVYLETSTGVDPIDLGEDYTLYEHIINTERYNFNRITWGKYIRGAKQNKSPTLTVDAQTRLQYPQDENYDLDDFASMARPYLQSWTIPLSMMSGVATNSTNSLAANFAYANIEHGYHKIKIDQHSLETKTRVNNYRIYDKKTTVVNVVRTCTTYRLTEPRICTDDDYRTGNGGCERPKTTYWITNVNGNGFTTISKSNILGIRVPQEDIIRKEVSCTDNDYKTKRYGCTRGQTKINVDKDYEVCVDRKVEQTPSIQQDVRENISSTDSTKTDYKYVLNHAKTFDLVVTNKYNFERYYIDNNRYNEDLTKTDSHSSETTKYYEKTEVLNRNFKENTKIADPSLDFSKMKIIGTKSEVIPYKTIVEKDGDTYKDTLIWRDKLLYDFKNSSVQKGYTIEQLKQYLGDSVNLSSEEETYYSNIAAQEKLNLIDLFNANKSIYTSYVVLGASENIGYNRSYLTTSYDVLKKNLSDLYTEYKYSIVYGQSLVPTIEYKPNLATSYDYSWLNEGSFGWPVPGNCTVGHLFGYTIAYFGSDSFHSGLDLWPDPNKGDYETEIVAARAGTVSVAKDLGLPNVRNESAGWGNYIKIDHGDGTHTLYAHLNTGSFFVTQGEHVEAGQVIAHMGSSGNSTGEHLHFELYNGKERVDPLIYIYNVKSKGKYPEYDMLTDEQKYSITQSAQYEYVSSK